METISALATDVNANAAANSTSITSARRILVGPLPRSDLANICALLTNYAGHPIGGSIGLDIALTSSGGVKGLVAIYPKHLRRMHMWNQTFFGVLGAAGLALLGNSASATTVFGSKLNHEPTPAETCKASKPADMCSWVLTVAQQNVGHERAPKNGTIAKLRLRSCSAGSFVLQLARANPGIDQAKATRTGPAINYKGSPVNCNGGNFIETFNVNVPVFTGDYLSVIATKVGFIYNSSGDGSLVFDPLLVDGGGFRTSSGTGLGAGILLLQALYND